MDLPIKCVKFMPKFTAKKEPPKGRNLTYLEDPGIMTTLFLGSERWGAHFLGSEQGDVQCILQEFTVTLVQLVIEETTYCFFIHMLYAWLLLSSVSPN